MIFLNLYTKISIEFWIRNTLLQKFLQTDMIFFDQFKVHTIKFKRILKVVRVQAAHGTAKSKKPFLYTWKKVKEHFKPYF